MRPPRRRGRCVPPGGPGPRPAPQPPARPPTTGPDAVPGGSGAGAEIGGADAASERARQLTRAQNRAAKRAASGVRPKAVRGGRVTGRTSRGYNPAIIGLAIAAVLVGAALFLIGNPFGAASPS